MASILRLTHWVFRGALVRYAKSFQFLRKSIQGDAILRFFLG